MFISNTTEERASITAFVLAGGAGSRLGFRDKALLQWRQRPFLAHIIDVLRTQADHVIINSNNAALTNQFSNTVITDLHADRRGPLAGIQAGLKHCQTPFALFVPCDNPRIAPDLAQRLYVTLHTHNADIAYAVADSSDCYLHVLIRTRLKYRLQDFLDGGQRAVRHWYAQEKTCRVDFEDQAECFTNINSEEDLARMPP